MKVINGWLKEPENYDKEFWQYYNYNIQQLAFHVHDGIGGDELPPSSLIQLQSTVLPTVPDTDGFFSEIVTLPAGNTFDNTTISFFLNGDRVYLDYIKVDDTSYKVISPYNTITFEVRYA